MDWTFKNKRITSIEDFPDRTIGFVYHITHKKTGLKYVGKKQLKLRQKVKLSNKQWMEINDRRKKKYKIVMRESNWKQYVGSNNQMKELLISGDLKDFKREIIRYCKTKKELTYYEVKTQFLYNVLEDSSYVNQNIAGRYFSLI